MDHKAELLIDLRGLRKEANLSVDRVAQLSGIGRSIIARMEIGDTPNLATALRMARFLETPVEEIWGLAEDNAAHESTETRER